MDSNLQRQQCQHHFPDQLQHQKQQMNKSPTRYRSSPSSYFASSLDFTDTSRSNEKGDFLVHHPLSPDTESIFVRLLSSVDGGDESLSNNLCDIPENSPVHAELMGPVKQEADKNQQQNNYTPSSQATYQNLSKPPFRNQNKSEASNSAMESSFRAPSSMPVDSVVQQMKMPGGSGTNLLRHNSLPAGFLTNINLDDGFAAIRGVENSEANNRTNEEASFASARRTIGQINVSSGLLSSSSSSYAGLDGRSFSNDLNNNGGYLPEYAVGSWDNTLIFSDDFARLERSGNDDQKTFSELNSSENQNGEGRYGPPLLAHHLSLPKTALEKLLQFQDSLPSHRIRAKRGMATHPRSIAERVRRTRISERIRKLQDLVPYMDKQTNTAEMLDMAVEYIKGLQKQVKTLTDKRAKCTCSS
ncbi:hypothetical protein Nepgr_009431 [Nepenthes gracilis]|uniref:BHLH domain-containing protein n=1 Tax=Nepenthes gracilis TaxID=150966 RepID=A0AAD3XKD5_NEPGR|nr:hypothetical protein Nepgr_009431 [Nepenthes gracilis]